MPKNDLEKVAKFCTQKKRKDKKNRSKSAFE